MKEIVLQHMNEIPAGLLDCDTASLHRLLGGPTLIRLEGRRKEPLFVSVLMHGNETTGWDAVRALLPKFQPAGGEQPLPRTLLLFIGNTAAAAAGVRHLPDQPDYNRVWPGSELPETAEHGLMQQLYAVLQQEPLFASVDLHNNTGLNPHYACINSMANPHLHLAALFGRIIVYFLRPKGVASMAMSALCPSVTLECGKIGQLNGEEHARQFLDACLHLSEIPDHPVATQDRDLFHTMAIVKIPESVSFGLAESSGDLQLVAEIDTLNFREIPPHTLFGHYRPGTETPLEVKDEHGQDVWDRYFEIRDGKVLSKISFMPSMLTRNCEVIRQDCLCYIMERMY